MLPVVVGAVIVVRLSKVWLWRGILGNIPSVVVRSRVKVVREVRVDDVRSSKCHAVLCPLVRCR